MADHQARILEAASQDLARLDKPVARRIVQRINWLATRLDEVRIEPLTGDLAGLYRLRVGDYRIIYEVLQHDDSDPCNRASSGDLPEKMRKRQSSVFPRLSLLRF